MINVVISGICGKIGKLVYEEARKDKTINVICGIDKKLSGDISCPVYSSLEEIAHSVDVIVDFSSTQAINGLLNYALNNGTALVLGTTGYTPEQLADIKKASKFVPVFLASNFSYGLYVVKELSKIASKKLPNCDVEIIETHHKDKVDAPSGTSLNLANEIKKTRNENTDVLYGRVGHVGKRGNEIAIHSVRGGNVVGTHEIIFFGEYETITITHSAQSKTVFAIGAVKALKFICEKKKGLFNIDDL